MTSYLNAKYGIEILHDDGITQILAGNIVPSEVGREADIGSVFLCGCVEGGVYRKFGTLDTDWLLVGDIPSYGSFFDVEEALTASNTTSTSYVDKLVFSTEDIPYGVYRIGWYYDWYVNANNSIFQFKITTNDVLFAEQTLPVEASSASEYAPASGFGYYVGAGVVEIKASYCGTRSGKTSSIKNLKIEIWRAE